MVETLLRRSPSPIAVGRWVAIATLFLCGCASKPPYTDRPYTPTGKVRFDSMESRRSTAAEPVVQQATREELTDSEDVDTDLSEASSGDSESEASEGTESKKTKCTDEQSSVLTLKTESYDITICETDGTYRYHSTLLPNEVDIERPASLSADGYYVNDGGYDIWVTNSSIAIYDGEELLKEEFAQ